MHRLLVQFHTDHRAIDSQIMDLLKTGETEQAAQQLHKLSGIAGNLGAVKLFDSCNALEKAVLEDTDRSAEINRFKSAFNVVMGGLDRLAARQQTPPAQAAGGQIDRAVLGSMIDDLSGRLKQQSFTASALLPKMRQALAGHFSDQFDELSAQVEAFEFEQAQNTLATLSNLIRPLP